MSAGDAADAVIIDLEDAIAVAGFAVTACIHRRQVDAVRAALRPDAGQVR